MKPGTEVWLTRPIETHAGETHPPYQKFFVVKKFKSRKMGLALEKDGDVVLAVFRKDVRLEPYLNRLDWLDEDWLPDDEDE